MHQLFIPFDWWGIECKSHECKFYNLLFHCVLDRHLVRSSFCLLQITLLCLLTYNLLILHIVLKGKYVGGKWLVLCTLNILGNCKLLWKSEWLYQFTSPQEVYESSRCSSILDMSLFSILVLIRVVSCHLIMALICIHK